MDARSKPASPLRALLAHGGYWRWSVAAQMARLPPLMTALAFVLAGTYATGGYASGGLMVSAYILAQVCFSPFSGRLLDRIGPATGASALLWLSVLGLSGLSAAVALGAPVWLLVVLAAVAGAAPAGVAGAVRGLLNAAVPERLLGPALAIDATVIEATVLTAPLLVLAAAVAGPPAGIFAMAAVAAGAALLVGGLSVEGTAAGEKRPDPSTPGERWTAWGNPRFVFWLLASVAFGHALGTAETGALPLAESLGGGTGGAAGLVAALALASALSGVAYAALAHRLPAGAFIRACVLLGLLALGCLGLGFATNWATAVAAMVALGACTAPLNTVRMQASENEFPPGRRAEAFSVLFAANGVGFALGGLLLAALPLGATLAAGGASAAFALLVAPLLLRHRRGRR